MDPLFFFHVEYGKATPDNQGARLPDQCAARARAVELLGELLRGQGAAFWENPSITITVTDADGLVLWRLDTCGCPSPANYRFSPA